jgi:NAD(P)-dependent dehydrogenase (short-subunit alcohol dehydrogenase family)
MSSCQAVIVIPEIAPYVMSKGGVNQWTKALGIRLAKEGIRVNAIGPGSIATEMFKKVSDDPAKMRNIMSRTPMGRAGKPSEIGDIAVFLASRMSSYITGQTIYPDGGRLGLNYTVPVEG